jgi:hypothetical protein
MLELNLCRWMHFVPSSSEEDKPESAKDGDSQDDTDDQNQQDAGSGLRLPCFGRCLNDTTLLFSAIEVFLICFKLQLSPNASVPGTGELSDQGSVAPVRWRTSWLRSSTPLRRTSTQLIPSRRKKPTRIHEKRPF